MWMTSIRANTLALLLLGGLTAHAQGDAREQLAAGHRLWAQRLSKSAVQAFEAATRHRETAAEAWEALAGVYMFKGWRQEGVFPGWHDETEYREKATAAFEASLRLDPSRTTAAEGLKEAQALAAAPGVVTPAPPRPEVAALDTKIGAWRTAGGNGAELEALIDARSRLQADPAPYFTAAQMMIERREYARALQLANRGADAAERFISENEGAYQMAGKSRGARDRSRAAALDIRGVVALERMDFAEAERLLDEAARLTRGQDAAVVVHLGDLAMARRDAEAAQAHYVNALSLTGGAEALRRRATEALMNLRASQEDSAGFDAWLEEAVAERRERRRAESLRSALDRKLPDLSLTAVDGRPITTDDFRGKVLLLNFFSSW
jgi:tetratricopeptide (TPR) repeat protein